MKLATLLGFALILMVSCATKKEGPVTTESGLVYIDLATGEGEPVNKEDFVKVHYTGWLMNDSTDLHKDWSNDSTRNDDQFDSSFDRNQPFQFLLGMGRVIRGWDEGVDGMKVGGKRLLLVPSDLGYGARDMGKIKANSNLKFVVEVIDVERKPKEEIVEDISGSGAELKKGDRVQYHYRATFLEPKEEVKVDTWEKESPVTGRLEMNEIHPMFENLIKNMRIGGKRTVIIPEFKPMGMPKIKLEFEVLAVVEEIDSKPWDVEGKTVQTTKSGLQYIILEEGTGLQAESGKNVKVHYSGYLANDFTKFDSSFDRHQPIEFPLGSGRVIKGWDEGIALLKEGTKARLIVPAKLGYGEVDKGSIPPNSNLVFDVQLIKVF